MFPIKRPLYSLNCSTYVRNITIPIAVFAKIISVISLSKQMKGTMIRMNLKAKNINDLLKSGILLLSIVKLIRSSITNNPKSHSPRDTETRSKDIQSPRKLLNYLFIN